MTAEHDTSPEHEIPTNDEERARAATLAAELVPLVRAFADGLESGMRHEPRTVRWTAIVAGFELARWQVFEEHFPDTDEEGERVQALAASVVALVAERELDELGASEMAELAAHLEKLAAP